MKIQTVVLGPVIDLHPGIHGSIRGDAPDGVVYCTRGGRHHFAFDRQPVGEAAHAPFEHPHLGELVDFGPGPQVVHSARWPVVGRRAWVADMDDFGYPFVLGRHMLEPKFLRPEEEVWSEEERALARRRTENMLSAFAHPSCKAILFRTHLAIKGAADWLRRLGLEEEGRPVLAKCRVLYPAQRCLPPHLVRQKWERLQGLQVLFVGQDYLVKNGRLALRVFQRLAADFPEVRFTYVGKVPDEDLELTRGLDFRGPLKRPEVLQLFREAHILFHPAREESFGMVLLEAAAHGLATIAAKGRGMWHLHEILGDEEALLLDRDAVAAEAEEEIFLGLLRSLLANPELARAKGSAAFRRAAEGALSLVARNEILRAVYEEGLEDPAPSGFNLEDLPGWEGLERIALRSGEVSEGLRSYCERQGIANQNFYIQGW